jgi:hypothetical protein
MSGTILGGDAETIEALDRGKGYAVFGNSNESIRGSHIGVGVLGVFGAPLAGVFDFPERVAVAGINNAEGIGVAGLSARSAGVYGINGKGASKKPDVGSGVWGESERGTGVVGISEINAGVHGINGKADEVRPDRGSGVLGESTLNPGVIGISVKHIGVYGKGGLRAAFFEGDVEVTGDIFLRNADCAEEFDIAEAEEVEPGAVMVINEEGALQQSRQAYDKTVAGVISGAGNFTPGITLDKQPSQRNRLPIALVGKVYCKVDAQYAPIKVGDPLTTSPTLGHAMKADDPFKAFGSVIGKALRPLLGGRGLIPILIALQ